MIKKVLYKDNQYISYTEYGNPNGFPLLVQHGMIASIKSGDIFNNDLKDLARIICIARPGYGESSAIPMNNYRQWGEITSCVINELSLTDFDIFSSSAGAPYGYAVSSVCHPQVRNIYVYSGMPAFYDELVRENWPYPIQNGLSHSEWEKITYDMFFTNATPEMLNDIDIKDSMCNKCFGLAQEFRLRFENWGFDLSTVEAKVFMQHSKQDEVIPYRAAERTTLLLPDCILELLEEGPHFSFESYQQFITRTIIPHLS